MCSTTFINYIISDFGARNIDPILDLVSEMQNIMHFWWKSCVYYNIILYTLT